MKHIFLLLSTLLFNSLFSQDTIKTSYKVDLTGIVNQVNGQSRTTLSFNLANSIKWKKFESTVGDRKSTRLNSSHSQQSRMPSSA